MKQLMTLLILCGFLFAYTGTMAQEKGGEATTEALSTEPDGTKPMSKTQKIEQLKATYIMKKITLTPKEEKVFWPIYNARSAEINKLKNEQKMVMLDLKKNMKEYDDAAKTGKLNEIVKFDKDIALAEFDYHQKFMKVIDIDKLIYLYKAEQEFMKEMLARYAKSSEEEKLREQKETVKNGGTVPSKNKSGKYGKYGASPEDVPGGGKEGNYQLMEDPDQPKGE